MNKKKDRSNYFMASPDDFIFKKKATEININKFDIPDEILEAAGIDPKKMNPAQLKAMFAQLAEKGLLKPKPGDKKVGTKPTGKKGASKEPTGAQGSGRAGLVKKKITVHRGGKVFQQERWVKAGEDEPVGKPKKGEEEPEGKAGAEDEPKKSKGLVIQGLNKPENKKDDEGKEIKGEEFMWWKPGEPIPGGVKIGSKVDIGKFGTHTVTDIIGGVIIGEDDKPYAITSIEEVIDVDGESSENLVSKLKPGMIVNVMDKDKVVTEIDEDNEIVFCEDGSGFSFGAINKFGKIKEKGAKQEQPKTFSMTKGNVTSMKGGDEIGLPNSVHADTIFIVDFKDGKGVYKISGKEMDVKGEIGYYGVAKELGWDNVPQTEKTDLKYGEGTCQAFVKGGEPMDKYTGGDIKINSKHFNDIAQIFVIDAIVGNCDRHSQNVKVNEDGRVWCIDNDQWDEESYPYHDAQFEEKFETLVAFSEGNTPKYDNKMYDWLEFLSRSEFKEFKTVVDEKLSEVVKLGPDKIGELYGGTGTGGFVKTIGAAQTYLKGD